MEFEIANQFTVTYKFAAFARFHGLTENLLVSSPQLPYCLFFMYVSQTHRAKHHFSSCCFSPSGKTASGSICFKLRSAYNWDIYPFSLISYCENLFLVEPGKGSNHTLVFSYVVKSKDYDWSNLKVTAFIFLLNLYFLFFCFSVNTLFKNLKI